jgi:hypothetical protein
MIVYMLHVAVVITTMLVFYKVLLRNETFYTLNRLMLLSCLVFAFVLPLIHVPQQWSFRNQGEVYIPAVQTAAVQKATGPIIAAEPAATRTTNVTIEEYISFFRSSTFLKMLQWLYYTGVAIFAINFFAQLFTLLYRAYSRPGIQDGRFRIVELAGDQAPCSFGNNIFINPEKYDWDTYSQILLHEKIHIQQGHSYDIILAELALVFQWFNPFAWLYRKAVADNLEFLTDNTLLKNDEIDPSSYQLSLVKVSAPHFPISLTTNYNQSILKRRLVMMNAKKSNLNTTWKYLFIMPLLMLFVCVLNEPIASANNQTFKMRSLVSGNTGIKTMGDEGNWFATIKNNTLDIRFEKDGDGSHSNNSSTFPLSDFKNLPRDQEGDFVLSREAGSIRFHGKFNGKMGMGTYKFSPDKAFMDNLRSAGVELDDQDDALVFFMVDVKRSYVTMLKNEGFSDITKDDLIPLAALKIDEPFIKSIKANGFNDVTLQNLIPLKALGVDAAYLGDISKSGYKNLTVDQLITLKSQGISGDFLRSAKQAQKEAAPNTAQKNQSEVIEKNVHTVVRETKESKDSDSPDDRPSMENIIAMKVMNVDADFRNGFKNIGFKVSDDDLIAMKALGVTPDFVKAIQSAGFTKVKTDEVISAKALGLSPDVIKGYMQLGFSNISMEDIISATAVGVTPAYISSMKKQGHSFETVEKYVEKKAVTSGIK